MSHNQISTFPVSLANLKQLAIVDLSYNRLTAVPAEAGKLEATELVLNCNQISVLAPEISSCPRLKTLRLEENCLALDSIPTPLLADRYTVLSFLTKNFKKCFSKVVYPCWLWRGTCLI